MALPQTRRPGSGPAKGIRAAEVLEQLVEENVLPDAPVAIRGPQFNYLNDFAVQAYHFKSDMTVAAGQTFDRWPEVRFFVGLGLLAMSTFFLVMAYKKIRSTY
jgi:hypothetical protein